VDAANHVRGFEDHLSTVVPWLQTTGIAEHIRGLKKDEIRAAIALPSTNEESVLKSILDGTENMLREALSWCFDGPKCMLTWPCRVVLSRFQSSQLEMLGPTRAFDHQIEPRTVKAYFKTAKQSLVYFDRVAVGRDYHFSASATSEEGGRPEDVIELTDEQRVTWCSIRRLARQRVESDESDAENGLEDQLLRMWMLLIRQETGARRYRSPLLSFCAMLSISPTTLCWMEPGDFNSHLSAMVWVVQLLIFYDSACREHQGEDSTIRLVKHTCEKYLQQTNETPMGEILRWRLLLFRTSKDTVKTRQATWDESEQVVSYEDTELHMDQIPRLLVSEYDECRRLLDEDLMFGSKEIRHIHAWELKDNVDVRAVDWNFSQHRDNERLLRGSDRALLAAIERSPHLCRTFLVEGGGISQSLGWRESALASYEATAQEYLNRLSTLIHMSAGTPVREPEFMSMTWRNTQRPRSITMRHGRVMIHLTYHKSQKQSGKYRDNIRFLAHPIADLVLDYIIYVTHLRQVFLRHESPTKLLSPFLWEKNGKVWPESKLSRCLEDACVRAQIPRLHISNWRQMTVAIVKTKFASDIGCFEMDPDDEDAEELEPDIQVLTKQRNHKTRTVNRAYANQPGPTFGNVWDGLIRMGLRASTLWQNFWGVETILADKKRKRNDKESCLVKRVARGIFKPRKPWPANALLGGLRKLYQNEEIQWKSAEQEQALTVIMSWTEQVVAILPTGAGKTALVMVPCTLPDAGITVLVLPLVSLRGDLLRRIQELGIDHLEWLPGERREASLVLISVEAASTKDFLKYAQSLVTQQKLDRIVIDECHLTVTAAEYRPSIVELAVVRSLRTQFVYLTATLPPSMQAEFEERNHLMRPVIIRSSSNRPNIFYVVRKATNGKGSLLQQAAAEAQNAWERPGQLDHSRDKIIMYVRTRDEAEELSGLLGCNSYTAESGSPEEKKAILTSWVQSSCQPYIVATTALAEGFDYPYVRLVVNVNEPESLVVFAQESGRAGRDGRRAYSLTLLPATWQPRDDTRERANIPRSSSRDARLRKQWERHAVHRYLGGEQCYRTSLSEYLDAPKQRRWCMTDDVPCDVCKVGHQNSIEPVQVKRREEAHTGLDVIQGKRLADYSELARYQEELAAVRGTCVLCRAMEERWDHAFSRCGRRYAVFEQRSKARQRSEAKGGRWLQAYTACFWCLQPQSICQRAEDGGDCEFGDVVLPACYGVFVSKSGRDWLREKFGREFDSMEEYFDWLGEETIFGGGRAIQGVRVASEKLGGRDG
jgi:superfamily II DNA helicase RecQ